MALPSEFPKDSVKLLLSVLTGNKPTTLDLVASAYDLIGYGLYVGFGGVPLMADDAEVAELKAQLLNPENQKQLAGVLPPFVWQLLFAAFQKLLERYLTPKV